MRVDVIGVDMAHSDRTINSIIWRLTGGLFIIFLVVFDHWAKGLALAGLGSGDLDLIPGILKLHYLQNTGAAFSILEGQQSFFLILTPLLILCIVVFALTTPPSKKFLPLHITYCFLISGAIGNFIDRVVQGYVTDFIYFYLIDFPVFNVADIYVTISMIALILLVLFAYGDEELEEILPWKRWGLKRKK